MKRNLLLFLLISCFGTAFGQVSEDQDLVQVSGIIMTSDSLRAVPYATVAVEGSSRGTFANFEGFFSIVVAKGEVLKFISLGYQDATYQVPEDVPGTRMTIVQLMTNNSVDLAEVIVFPWPSREHFRLEFLAMDVQDPFLETAQANLAQQRMAAISENMIMDGNENSDFYLRQQAQTYYYAGQAPPMHIFNAFAWRDFINSWKKGKYKKKKDKDEEPRFKDF
ncbi:MAG: carboxypeptidase-like regulatory domain-containing protein [Bacteroidota bacterium]